MYQKQVSIVPAGTVISCIRSSMPAGYLACDGSKYNVSDYPVLYAALKDLDHTGWAEANWTTEFTVPDLRGEFLRGTGTNGHSNQGSGSAVGKHQNATEHIYMRMFKEGSYGIQIRTDSSSTTGLDPSNFDSVINKNYWINGQLSWGNSSDTGGISKFTSRPTNTSVLYCIKY